MDNLKIIEIDELNTLSFRNVLYVIGNGFDLMHNVPSRYRDFDNSLKSTDEVKKILDYFIDKDDIWGDFEDSLAHLDRELMINYIDHYLEIGNAMDDEDDDFSVAGFLAVQELVAIPGKILTLEMPKRFRSWVKSLKVNKDFKPLLNVLKRSAKYITFNYTEFLEIVYNIPKSNIVYIHGERRNKEEFILGHGYEPDALLDNWIEKNKHREELQPYIKNRKGKLIPNSNPTYLAYFADDFKDGDPITHARYHAIDGAIGHIEEYYEESLKKTRDVLDKYKEYFNKLDSIEHIVVIGHSLSNVDYPYFEEIINNVPSNINWYFTYYNDYDIEKIGVFIKHFNINKNNIILLKQ